MMPKIDGTNKLKVIVIAIVLLVSANDLAQQIYTNEFSIGDVTLLPSPFKSARELNIKTLLQYDTDRLLEPFLTEAGLNEPACL